MFSHKENFLPKNFLAPKKFPPKKIFTHKIFTPISFYNSSIFNCQTILCRPEMSTVVRKSSYHSHQNNPLQSTDVQLAARGREGLCHLRLFVRGLRPAGALGSLAGEHPIKVHFEEIVNYTFSGGEGAEEATATSTESE